MHFDLLWHHWLMLRPLLVFVLATPLIIMAVLGLGRGEPRASERKSNAAPLAPGAIADGHSDRRPSPGVAASPHEWHGGGAGPDRRAA